MKQKEIMIFIGDKHIDTVYFDEDMSRNQIVRALTEHDGYPEHIEIFERIIKE